MSLKDLRDKIAKFQPAHKPKEMPPPRTHKRCTVCGELQTIDQFYTHGEGRTTSQCAACNSILSEVKNIQRRVRLAIAANPDATASDIINAEIENLKHRIVLRQIMLTEGVDRPQVVAKRMRGR